METPTTRIVLADDHEVVRTGVRAMFEQQPGFSVCGVARNGQEVVDKVLELKPDIVILDLSMPLLSGFQAAIKIRQLMPAIKIFILSIHDTPLLKQVAHLLNVDGYLPKTATREEIIAAVNSVLERGISQPQRFPRRLP